MPYKITGVDGLSVENLSLKEARSLAAKHLESLPYEYVQHNGYKVGGKIMVETHFIVDEDILEDADIKNAEDKIELVRIEYMEKSSDGN